MSDLLVNSTNDMDFEIESEEREETAVQPENCATENGLTPDDWCTITKLIEDHMIVLS